MLVFSDSRINTKIYRDAIFTLGLTGEASFHSMLTCMALFLRLAPGPDVRNDCKIRSELNYELEEEMAHQSKVHRLVASMIRNKEATSDDAIGDVAALASYVVSTLLLFAILMESKNEGANCFVIANIAGYACLENPHSRPTRDDQTSWWHSDTRLKSTHSCLPLLVG
jgi:hypothetical protein